MTIMRSVMVEMGLNSNLPSCLPPFPVQQTSNHLDAIGSRAHGQEVAREHNGHHLDGSRNLKLDHGQEVP